MKHLIPLDLDNFKEKFTLLPHILQPFFAYFATCDLFGQFEMFQENDLPENDSVRTSYKNE